MSAGAVEDAIVQQIISPDESFSKGAEGKAAPRGMPQPGEEVMREESAPAR